MVVVVRKVSERGGTERGGWESCLGQEETWRVFVGLHGYVHRCSAAAGEWEAEHAGFAVVATDQLIGLARRALVLGGSRGCQGVGANAVTFSRAGWWPCATVHTARCRAPHGIPQYSYLPRHAVRSSELRGWNAPSPPPPPSGHRSYLRIPVEKPDC